MSEDGVQKKSHTQILRLEQIERIIDALSELGIKKIRFTGGEPLVRKGAVELIKNVSENLKIEKLAITTNGSLLPKYIDELKKTRLDSYNISIDSLDKKKYEEITRGGNLQDAICAVEAVKKAGFESVKINAVLMKNFNDDEIFEFAKFGKKHNVLVRFIELMPFEDQSEFSNLAKMTFDEVLEKYPNLEYIGNKNSTNARYYKFSLGEEIGFINAMSHKFCDKCNRIRITADGKLLNCLHESKEFDLKPYLDDKEQLKQFIKKAVLEKPKCHHLENGAKQKRIMTRIGG